MNLSYRYLRISSSNTEVCFFRCVRIGNESLLSGGVSRAKLSNVMATYVPLARQEVMTLVVRFADMVIEQRPDLSREVIWWRIGILLSHNSVRNAASHTLYGN